MLSGGGGTIDYYREQTWRVSEVEKAQKWASKPAPLFHKQAHGILVCYCCYNTLPQTNGLKEHKCFTLQLCRLEAQRGSHWTEVKMLARLHLFLEAACIPWLMAPFHLQSNRNAGGVLTPQPSDCFCPHLYFWEPIITLGPWTVQVLLPILRSAEEHFHCWGMYHSIVVDCRDSDMGVLGHPIFHTPDPRKYWWLTWGRARNTSSPLHPFQDTHCFQYVRPIAGWLRAWALELERLEICILGLTHTY